MQPGLNESPRGNVAMKVAERIESEIGTLAAGSRLGTEQELIRRLGVSRGSFRQAVRCLERNGVARSCRGAGGGLMVARSALERSVAGVKTTLEMLGPPLSELSEISALLKREIVASAALYANERQARSLRILAARAELAQTLEDYALLRAEFQNELSVTSGQITLSIFLTAISQAMVQALPISKLAYETFKHNVKRLQSADRAVAEAIAARDPRRAENAAEAAAEIEISAFMASLQQGLLPDAAQTAWTQGATAEHAKSGERVAWRLRARIADLPPETRLGSEAQLAGQFGVGRAVLREGLRILEDFNLVHTRRGVGGGVFSGSFCFKDVIAALSRRIEFAGADKLDIWRARLPLETESARQAAGRRMETNSPVGLSAQLAGGTGALAFLIAITEQAIGMDKAPAGPLDERLASAVRHGDRYLACRFAIERCDHFRDAFLQPQHE